MSKSRSRSHIEQDFRDALDRLRAGRPQNPELRNRLKRGQEVKINISNVAKEAGRARTLIARADCQFPEIRHLVLLEAGEVRDAPRNSDDVIRDLRVQVAELTAENRAIRDRMADHFETAKKAEKLAERERNARARATTEIEGLRRQIAKLQSGAKVVALHGGQDA